MENSKIFVKIQTHGHLSYYETWGELLSVTIGIENCSSGIANYMQVPALVIKTTNSIIPVNLQSQYSSSEVSIVTEKEYEDHVELSQMKDILGE